MHDHSLIFSLFLIFSGAAVLATAALFTRQSLLVAYILLGMIVGPWGFNLVGDSETIRNIGNIGILFLLFLLGLHLPPQKLFNMLKKVSWVGLVSSIVFAGVAYLVGWVCGYTPTECLVLGAAMIFSSTIIGIKLLPTTILHHQHTGEVMISVLLMQDLLAIVVLLLLHGSAEGKAVWGEAALLLVGLPGVLVFAFLIQNYLLLWLFRRFERIREYMFLLAIGWCLSLAALASYLGLSDEIGAFIAGVSLATSPIALYIAESLKPVRDFFLVMFFFSVGASFNLNYLSVIIIPALVLAALLLVIKPITFRILLRQVNESKHVSWEVGFRLGQISEFSLIIAFVAQQGALISPKVVYLIQAAAILTFVASSYFVVMRYPTPIAISEKLRRD